MLKSRACLADMTNRRLQNQRFNRLHRAQFFMVHIEMEVFTDKGSTTVSFITCNVNLQVFKRV